MYTTVIAREEKYEDVTGLVIMSKQVSQTNYSRSIPHSAKADTVNGSVVLIEPTTKTFTTVGGLSELRDKYIDLNGAIYYIPTDATFSQVNVGGVGSVASTNTAQASKARRMYATGLRVAPGAGPGNRLRKCDIHGLANDADDLMLGSVCASWIEATIHSTDGNFTVYNGDELTVYKVALDGTETQVGVFNVTDARWISKRVYKITAYDNVIKLDRDITGWLRGLTEWPYALTEFYGMIATECGLESGYSTWSGASSFMVHKFDVKDGTTGRQLMGTICEVMGDYCIARADGVLTAAWYNSGYIKIHHSASQVSSGATIDIHRFQNSLEYGDYDVDDVKCIQFREEQSKDAALWPDYGTDADVSNAYIITGNPIVLAHPTYLTTTTGNNSIRGAFEKIATRFDFQRYRAFKVTIPEFLPAQVGKYVFMGDENDKIMFYAPITSMTWKGNKMVLECGAKQTRATADSPDNWSNTQLAQYSDRVISRTPQEQLFEKMAGPTPGLNLTDGKISMDQDFQHDGMTVSVANHYYNGSSDTAETSFEAWLSNQLSGMANQSVRDVAFRCYAVWNSDGRNDVFYGRLCRHNANYAVLYGFNYGGLVLLKRLYNGTWQASQVQKIGG